MASNAKLGKLVLCLASFIFIYYFFWVAVLPFMRFVDEDNWILSCFPALHYAFEIPVAFGTVFVGSIMCFTMYHAERFIWFF